MIVKPQRRRDFLHMATAATGAALLGAAGWGLIRTASPSATRVSACARPLFTRTSPERMMR